jgi:RHS repeat-associated protein
LHDLHRLVSSASSDGVDNSYAYDRAGNRTQWVTDHAPDTNAALTVNATYDAAGELTKEVKTRPGLLGISTNTATNYTYDGNGNRTRMQTGSAVTDYTYTADDRLAGIDQGLREVAYEYDGLGRALTETVWSLLELQSEVEQVWDGMVVVAQNSAAGTTSLVRDVLGDVAVQSTPGLLGATDTRWGLTDRLGSTIGQAQGSKVGQLAEYSDWGVPTFDTLGWNSETGYTGELGDTTAGLVNFYVRSYDPSAGSWLQADPYRGTLTDPETLGRYGYVTGNPTTLTDAFGYAASNRMLHDSSGGGHARAAQLASLARQEAAMVNRHNAGHVLGKPRSPADASDPSDRHGPDCAFEGMRPSCGASAGQKPYCDDLVLAPFEPVNCQHDFRNETMLRKLLELALVLGLGPLASRLFAALARVLSKAPAPRVPSAPVTGSGTPPKPAQPPTVGGPKPAQNFLPPTNPPQLPPTNLPPGYTVRVMGPTGQYPNGYWRVTNQHGRYVNPSTMKPPSNVTKAEFQAQTHVPVP